MESFTNTQPLVGITDAIATSVSNSTTTTTTTTTAATATATSTQLPQRKRRPKKKKPPPTGTTGTSDATTANTTTKPTHLKAASHLEKPGTASVGVGSSSQAVLPVVPSKNQVRNAKRKNQLRKKKEQEQNERQKHAWWREQVPTDSVDPITLESLQSLQYPPFALVASPPYIPMNWPPIQNDTNDTTNHREKGLSEEERQRQILQAQWGKSLHIDNNTMNTTDTDPTSNHHRHVNLFDGRALAYYMVSQLQFIDPLNRRDITRDELIHLDHYLRRHHFYELNVVEAYDTKGVTLSSAGATANTAMGRSIILQQEAQTLLNALFGGNTVSRSLPASSTANSTTTNTGSHIGNTFMEQYEAHEATHRRPQATSNTNRPSRHQTHDSDTYMTNNVLTDSGMVIIDDDETPGLRGNASAFPFYSANHIAARHGNGRGPPVREYEFPSLAATVQLSTRTEQEPPSVPVTSVPKNLPKAKTLSKIGKMVKQTNPEEQQRQWEAREEARRKAMLANLTFGSNPTLPTSSEVQQQLLSDGIPSQISTVNGPSIAQVERNRAFAEALGVQPATLRSNTLGGWTRPTERIMEYDEFGNELNYTIYPDSLIKQAKELRLDMILKLEKKWKLFLNDDRAASLPLYPMDRTNRAFVHEYAEYWKLHTESFDPEPKRYVHCVKLRDTCAPHPLISDAMKNWQPFNQTLTNRLINEGLNFAATLPMDHSTNQTAGQSTTSSEQQHQTLREFPADVYHQRVPLSLKPRSTLPQTSVTSLSGGVSIGGVPSRNTTMMLDGLDNRFASLSDGRERPKLELQKRTLPLELPAYDASNTGPTVAVDLNVVHLQQMERHQQKVRKEQEKAQRKQRALQSAFASDDEKSDSDSEWEEKVAVYHSSSDEDES